MSGKIRRFFAGGNTSEGFYSFYHHMIKADATRFFIIKGGPGTGKSTFMKYIGEEMNDRGYNLEYHHCSSDKNSIDGVVITDLNIALVDGTAPHAIDPKTPGAVDEIINMGEFWNLEGIIPYKKSIMQHNKAKKDFFNLAYSNLSEAKIINNELEFYIAESMDFASINQLSHEVLKDVFMDVDPDFSKLVEPRRLFASAYTPQGEVTALDTIIADVEKVYLFKGEHGSGKSTLLTKILEMATWQGIFTEAYHNPLDPSKLDSLVIPSLKLAFITHDDVDLSDFTAIEVDFNKFSNKIVLDFYESEIKDCKQRLKASCERAISFTQKAMEEHNKLEEFYIDNMDFERINEKKAEILERILEYAEDLA